MAPFCTAYLSQFCSLPLNPRSSVYSQIQPLALNSGLYSVREICLKFAGSLSSLATAPVVRVPAISEPILDANSKFLCEPASIEFTTLFAT